MVKKVAIRVLTIVGIPIGKEGYSIVFAAPAIEG
jgi:hypothetical protein